jgi:signal transduction histidine kinase/ligand-binding sensor domain-containing protein
LQLLPALLRIGALLAGAQYLALNAQPPASYLRTNFADREGLSSNIINAIVQTGDGTLWVGTGNSLDRFDGHSFSHVQTRAARALTVGRDGDLWAATSAGIVRVPLTQLDRWEDLSPLTYHLGKDREDAVTCLLVTRDGTVWASNSSAIFRLTGNSFQLVVAAKSTGRLEEAANGHLLIIGGDNFQEWDGQRLLAHPELPSLLGVLADQIFHVIDDPLGVRWYATADGVKRIQNGAAQRFIGMDRDPKSKMAAYRIFPDRDANLLTSAGNSAYFLRSGNLAMDPILAGQGARALYVDRDGDLWVGTNGFGLNRFRKPSVQMFTVSDGLPNLAVMTVLAAHDGKLWVGNNCGGISWFDGTRFHTLNNFFNTCVTSIAEDAQHVLWLGTFDGIFRFDGSVFTQFSASEGLADKNVRVVRAAEDGSLWLVTSTGVSRFKDGRFRNYTTADGLSSNRLADVYVDHAQQIWAGSLQGIDRLEGDRFVRASSEPLDEFWMLSAGVLDGFIAKHEEQGMRQANARLSGVLNPQTTESALKVGAECWFGGAGITRISLDALRRNQPRPDEPLDRLELSEYDGLTSQLGGSTQPAAARTPDGRLWFAQFQGLAMVDPASFKSAPRAAIHMGAITVDRKPRPPGSGLVLSPGPHHVELHFDTIEISFPEHTHLQYKLDGVESTWFDAEPVHGAIYNNLPPGTHAFHVRACNRDGVWDREGIVFPIIQEPYFYQTSIFQLSALGAGILLMFALHKRRMRQASVRLNAILEERLAERERIAQDLHDTLLQGFISASLQLSLANRELSADSTAKSIVAEVLDLMKAVIEEGRTAVRGMRLTTADSSDLEKSFSRIRAEVITDRPVNFRVFVEGPERVLHTLVRDDVYRIGREAIINAFRHSAAANVEVELRYSDRDLRLFVRDDGCGIEPQVLRHGREGHWGLSGMRETAERIRAKLHLQSRLSEGTEVELTVPAEVAFAAPPHPPARRWWRTFLPGSRSNGQSENSP